MNKLKNLYLMCIVVLMGVVATSCDSDFVKAVELDGIWKGTLQGTYYYDRYSDRGEWDTEIQFMQKDLRSKGTGVEIDYSYSQRKTYRSRFDWVINDGNIIIKYRESNYQVIIHDYDLYDVRGTKRFRGYIDDYATGEEVAHFDLIKIADWSDDRDY